ncbi:MAG: rplC [Candidatus Saccharibacteria bacterium]|jgi:large subunit ribosomal protein L3|nr:rplC [Candidatus Saccharibacteria bacterium]
MKALLGTKLGMTQLFDADGNVARVTLIQAGPCVVTQVKTTERDGYNAVQIGFGDAKHQPKPQAGHLKASGSNARVTREVRINDVQPNHPEAKTHEAAAAEALALEVGAQIDVTAFEAGDEIQVTGTSKGKGFAGTIKRHNFSRGPKTHGSRNYRAPGSIGAGYPEHVFKGMRMAGHMGHEQVTVAGLKVVVVDEKLGVLAVSGAVPGPKKGLVMVRGK